MKFINRFVVDSNLSAVTCHLSPVTCHPRNAYILTSVEGTNFCRSAKEAFSLIMRNMVRTNTGLY